MICLLFVLAIGSLVRSAPDPALSQPRAPLLTLTSRAVYSVSQHPRTAPACCHQYRQQLLRHCDYNTFFSNFIFHSQGLRHVTIARSSLLINNHGRHLPSFVIFKDSDSALSEDPTALSHHSSRPSLGPGRIARPRPPHPKPYPRPFVLQEPEPRRSAQGFREFDTAALPVYSSQSFVCCTPAATADPTDPADPASATPARLQDGFYQWRH